MRGGLGEHVKIQQWEIEMHQCPPFQSNKIKFSFVFKCRAKEFKGNG